MRGLIKKADQVFKDAPLSLPFLGATVGGLIAAPVDIVYGGTTEIVIAGTILGFYLGGVLSFYYIVDDYSRGESE